MRALLPRVAAVLIMAAAPSLAGAAPSGVDAALASSEWAAANALFEQRLFVAAASTLGPLVENPTHPFHAAAVARLATIARELDEAAALERWFGSVTLQTLAALPPSIRGSAAFLVAKHRYGAARWDDALSALNVVGARDPERARALFLTAATEVRRRASVRAVEALFGVAAALDAAPPSYDRVYFRDLALMSVARIYFAAAARLDENNAPTLDSPKLSAAVKYYEKVDAGSTLFPEAAHELAWAFFLAGDHAHALGHARWLSSPSTSSEHAADAEAMSAHIHFQSCDYAGAREALRSLRARAIPLAEGLTNALTATDARGGDAYVALVVAAREGTHSAVGTEIARAAVERTTARRLAHLARVDRELKALGSAPVRSALERERTRVAAAIGDSVRRHIVAKRDEMVRLLDDARSLERAISTGEAGTLDPATAGTQMGASEGQRNVMRRSEVYLDFSQPRLPYALPRYATLLFHRDIPSTCKR
jgi:hypothetical protein